MARFKSGGNHGTQLRRWLIGLEIATMGTLLLGVSWPDGKGALIDQLNDPGCPPAPELTPEQLASPFAAGVRALQAGEAYEFSRGDLPDWCPQRHFGAPHDRLVLNADDTISEVAR